MKQKTINILSMAFVLVASVLVNEIVLKATTSDKERDVASFGERYEPNQIKWEHELANTISKNTDLKTVVAMKPNDKDQLLFEVLEGRYEARMESGKIHKISLLPNQMPVEIKTNDFMKKYLTVAKNISNYETQKNNDNSDTVVLKNSSGTVVGQLKISRDDQGRVLSIEEK